MDQFKMEKYLQRKPKMNALERTFSESKNKNKIKNMLIRDEEGNVLVELGGGVLVESEDGTGTMNFTAHPHGGAGRIGYNKGIRCPKCGANIDLRK